MSTRENEREKARSTAENYLRSAPPESDFEYAILDEHTIERRSCFVFFYESSRFLETGALEDRLAGNAPILVDRRTGTPRFLGSAESVERYIEKFEAADQSLQSTKAVE